MQVVWGGVGDFVLKVKENALGGGYGDSVLALILLDELPEGVHSILLLEGDCHNLIFLNLRPLYPIYHPLTKITFIPLEVYIRINSNLIRHLSLR